MITYCIVDKDERCTEVIKTVLDEFPEFVFIGRCENEEAGMETILREEPDIVFLDIDETLKNLGEFLQEVRQYADKESAMVALSLTKDMAYDVFKFDFLDYLLKTPSALAVRKTILRYKKRHPVSESRTLCLKSYKDYQYLQTDEILIVLKADNNTTDFYMQDGSLVGAFKTLKSFEGVLPENFLRIHKSYIINKNYISRISYGKSICLLKKHSYKVPFTKTFIDNVAMINESLVKEAFMALN